MYQDKLTLYKLIVLYMLSQVDFPLTTSQVSEFILDKGYASYLSLQQSICELIEANLVRADTIRNRTLLYQTNAGEEMLHFFGNKVSKAIKQDIYEYIQENEIALKSEVSVSANYYESPNGDYEVKMIAKEKNGVLIDLVLSVPTKELAISMCEKWDRDNQKIYQYLMENLL